MTGKIFRAIVASLVFGLVAGCAASGPEKEELSGTGIDIEGFVIRNKLDYAVYEVIVESPSTGRFAGCGNIMPRSDCRSSFPAIEIQQNAVLVRWEERGEAMSTGEFVIDFPADAKRGDSYWLEIIIYAPGLAGARLSQP